MEANLLIHLQEKLGDQSNYVILLATLKVLSKLLDYGAQFGLPSLLRALSRCIEDSRTLLSIEELIEQTVKLTDHENRNIRQQVIAMLTTMLRFGQLYWTRGVRYLSYSHYVDHTRKKFLDVDVLFDLKWLLRGQDTEVSMVYCLYEMTKHGALVWFPTGWGFLK